VLSVGGSVTHPLELTLAELKKMPHKTVTVLNPHSNKSEVYEGVLLQDLLGKASVPQGHELRGPAMDTVLCSHWPNWIPIFRTPM
jgi:DMSO/TMAO reductase YedYZ molybdopterin-dependent catalytic subunit